MASVKQITVVSECFTIIIFIQSIHMIAVSREIERVTVEVSSHYFCLSDRDMSQGFHISISSVRSLIVINNFVNATSLSEAVLSVS